jgi:chromosome segregation ATPase
VRAQPRQIILAMAIRILTISQVELNLFTERHDELAGAARRAEADARTERARADALQHSLGGTRGREDDLVNEVSNLNASLDALTEQNGQLQRDYGELSERHRQQGSELSKASASLQVTQETGDARHAMLAGRLEASLRELQAVLGERDALKASLDEALGRCASSVVSAQLAEASQAHMQEQLTALRQQQNDEALSPTRSPLRAPPARSPPARSS